MNAPSQPSLAVLLCTTGRPRLVAEFVAALGAQTRPPDRIIVVGAEQADIAEIGAAPNVMAVVGRRGSAHQRNDALALAGAHFDTIVFFDDDFVPAQTWLQRAESLFQSDPQIAGLTGAVLADGNKSAGIAPDEARQIVAARDANPFQDFQIDFSQGPYGCNMAFRGNAIEGLAFDERLPLYAWLEDKDFGERARQRGKCGKTPLLWGVHLGVKSGRVAGLRLGYSQIANAVYLTRKGTIPVGFAAKLMAGNLAANLSRSLRPEAWVDRRGRLRGNLLALGDALLGRLAPERAAQF